MRCQKYEITLVGQAGTALCAEFDDCAITIGPAPRPFAPSRQIRVPSWAVQRISSLGLEVGAPRTS